ncbi:hypothetical protein [Pseudomonas fluorescens]|uniref:hypothetical protein n=1 Tax=Pseudomonas fluorescens TaxID=294 RepID=UPI0010E76FCE|nr:hypothetical protein [Pseudomonas fluorescens]TCV62694.1 hypothetical protein EDB98_1122 [Pseudomonas fluorescens]
MNQSDVVAISFAATVFGLAVGIGLLSQGSGAVGFVSGMVAIAGGSLNGFFFMRGALNYLQSSTNPS